MASKEIQSQVAIARSEHLKVVWDTYIHFLFVVWTWVSWDGFRVHLIKNTIGLGDESLDLCASFSFFFMFVAALSYDIVASSDLLSEIQNLCQVCLSISTFYILVLCHFYSTLKNLMLILSAILAICASHRKIKIYVIIVPGDNQSFRWAV